MHNMCSTWEKTTGLRMCILGFLYSLNKIIHAVLTLIKILEKLVRMLLIDNW